MNFNQIGKEENKKKIMCGFKKKTEPQFFFKVKIKKTKQIFHFIRLWNIKEQKN